MGDLNGKETGRFLRTDPWKVLGEGSYRGSGYNKGPTRHPDRQRRGWDDGGECKDVPGREYEIHKGRRGTPLGLTKDSRDSRLLF